MDNQKICILGSSGFIGRNLHSAIRQHSKFDSISLVLVDYTPVEESRSHPEDIFISANSKTDLMAEALSGTTVCVNLASMIFAEKASPEMVLSDYLEASLSPIHSIFPFIKDTLEQWVQLSSISVYQAKDDGSPLRESDSLKPPNAYGVSKLAAERYLLTARKSFDICLQILRMPDVYGPEPRSPLDQRLFPSLQRAFLGDEKVWKVFGTGDEKRDMIHVADACAAILRCLAKPTEGIWNVGSQVGISVNELVEILKPLSDQQPHIDTFPERTVKSHLLDSQKFSKEFNFECQINFKDGVEEEFNFHQQHKS